MIEKILQLCPKMEDYLDGIITSGEYTNLTENNFLKVLGNPTFTSVSGYTSTSTSGDYYNGHNAYLCINSNNDDITATECTYSASNSYTTRVLLLPTYYSGVTLGRLNNDDIFVTKITRNSSHASEVYSIAAIERKYGTVSIAFIPSNMEMISLRYGSSTKQAKYYILWKKTENYIIPMYIFQFGGNYTTCSAIKATIPSSYASDMIGQFDEDASLNINQEFYNRNVNVSDTSNLANHKINIDSSIISVGGVATGATINVIVYESYTINDDSDGAYDDDSFNIGGNNKFYVEYYNQTAGPPSIIMSPENWDDPGTNEGEEDGYFQFVGADPSLTRFTFEKYYGGGTKRIVTNNFFLTNAVVTYNKVLNFGEMLDNKVNFNTLAKIAKERCDIINNPYYNSYVYGRTGGFNGTALSTVYGAGFGVCGKATPSSLKTNMFYANNLMVGTFNATTVSKNNATKRYILPVYAENAGSGTINEITDDYTYYVIPKYSSTATYQYPLGFGTFSNNYWYHPVAGPTGRPYYPLQGHMTNRCILDGSCNYIAKLDFDGNCKMYKYKTNGQFDSSKTYKNMITEYDELSTNYWDILNAINTHWRGKNSNDDDYPNAPIEEINGTSRTATRSIDATYQYKSGKKIVHISANAKTIINSDVSTNAWGTLFLGKYKGVAELIANTSMLSAASSGEMRFYPGYSTSTSGVTTTPVLHPDGTTDGDYMYIIPSMNCTSTKMSIASYNSSWNPAIDTTTTLANQYLSTSLSNYNHIVVARSSSYGVSGNLINRGVIYRYDKYTGDFIDRKYIGITILT